MKKLTDQVSLRDLATSANLPIPSVLVVDRDSADMPQYDSILSDLGYQHYCAITVNQAIQHINNDLNIQIVMVNVHNLPMNVSDFIRIIRGQSYDRRPIAVIMVADKLTIEMTIFALHGEAVDILCKPLELAVCSTSFSRALSYLNERRLAIDSVNISRLGKQLARLVSVLEEKFHKPAIDEMPNEEQVEATIQWIIRSRNQRSRFFPTNFFADPAWDILLDLTRAELGGQQVSVSSVCIAASVPMSTALRWVRQMTDANLLRRWTDPMDRRRDLVALTPETSKQMREYLAGVYKDSKMGTSINLSTFPS